MKFLITAGPTREPIDAVRYISNFSSGKMGYALAKEAVKRGNKVILISGPVATETQSSQRKASVSLIKVETTEQMRKTVLKYIPKANCLIMAAAVSDYRPAHTLQGKMKKTQDKISLKLVRNPDILKEIGAKTRNKILVGFALETKNLLKYARAKAREKRLDYIVANPASVIGRDSSDAMVLDSQGRIIKQFRQASKATIARFIIRLAEKSSE
ncbi:MAG: phosphopantothenoylcysteine decarboxylase [Planctomycetes bacterium]|nr:phosphopantothenoylcysteine decarboxylase [Planctomycetota bacterium]